MKAKLLAAAAVVCAGSGCVVTEDDGVQAGDPLDAHFELTWVTNDAATGAEVDCYSAGADTVRVRSRNILTGDELVDLFDCDARTGETSALPAGEYAVSVDLVACSGDRRCSAPRVVSTLAHRTLYQVWEADDIDLGHFVFLVR